MDLLAAVDLRAGRAVRLVQGDFGREQRYGDPLALAERFLGSGVGWLHVVDLDAARTGRAGNRATVVAIAERAAAVGVRVQTGGGVRRVADVEELLEAGLARVVLGTAAVVDPGLARDCAERFPGRVALGLDYRPGPDGQREVALRGWLEGSGVVLEGVLEQVAGSPLGAVVVTAIDRDGTLAGPDLEGLAEVLDRTEIPVVASGGVGSLEDLRRLGALRGPASGRRLSGVIAGKALADRRIGLEEGLRACAASG